MMKADEIRKRFLNFFAERGHTIVPSSSLIPKDDPTLLFTNAGMVQFKNCFLGIENRGYTRAASVQKCVRAGGKHNDLENVGYTARHHTFFEMLGNFSFGDYFKRESITWGWEFLTREMGIEAHKLWITIYEEDDEAFAIWRDEIGVPADRIVRMGMESNFWMMGDTGPCGPCSEIIYDQGPSVGCGRPDCSVLCDCDRYLELWNHVFTQYERDENGNLHPLPKPNIDTGMGLERLVAVLQGVASNYDTDLFMPIIQATGKISGKHYGESQEWDVSLRVIADHIRAVTFLLGDGCLPSNEGRGYVLRRILRRAVRHGKILGLDHPFLHELVPVVISIMGDTYPDIRDKESFIRQVIMNEEKRFNETLDTGLRILREETAALSSRGEKVVPGEVVFRLYDTFGFPVDLTADIVRKDGLTLDMAGFEKAMEEQREKARESWKGSGEEALNDAYKRLSSQGVSVTFVGYHGVVVGKSRIIGLLKGDEIVSELKAGEKGEIIVEETPFYGEKGGQVGDTGVIEGAGFEFEVWDTAWPLETLITHIGKVKSGTVRLGDEVTLKVDEQARRAIEANHSGTHVLNAALRRILGDHVKQAGSYVAPDRLRFDFTHFSRIEEEDLEKIEKLANSFIRANAPVETTVMDRESAMRTGAAAVFDEKYGATVRVVKMGDFSMELCGGTHVENTGEIGSIKIISESSVAAGVRRIEAVTGEEAERFRLNMEKELKKTAELLKTHPLEVADRVEKLLKNQRELEREIEALKGKLAARDSRDMVQKAREVNGVKVLSAVVEAPDVQTLRDYGDKVRDRLGSGIILLGSRADGKALLLCMVTKDLAERFHAGEIVKQIAPLVGGKGGGRPEMAQAGGPMADKLEMALEKIWDLVK
ncbi:MAG TPA: alanine--tRNA ligase [Syntrophales bacterium]|nr:alanine--tRNA ligase [Syntrophales bacterium]HOL59053.1 alanine--tRNA ligase [Syntrophales bacterium]HPO35438.1 alanine--tRNA ligase [Syntrophales bacterium]